MRENPGHEDAAVKKRFLVSVVGGGGESFSFHFSDRPIGSSRIEPAKSRRGLLNGIHRKSGRPLSDDAYVYGFTFGVPSSVSANRAEEKRAPPLSALSPGYLEVDYGA